MRLLVLSTCYPQRRRPDFGIFIHRQVRALVDMGVECHVLQPVDWSPPAPLHLLHPGWREGRRQQREMLSEVDGIPVHHPIVFHPKPSRFFPGDHWERVGWAVARFIRARARLRSADVMVAHFLCHEGYAGLVAAKGLGMPLVAVARGDDVHGWPERWPDRKPKLAAVLKHADGLLACSHGLAREAARWAVEGLARPFEIVYNGVDTELFSPIEGKDQQRTLRVAFGLPQERRLLLCVATPIRAKGWLDLFDAWKELSEEVAGWDLVMVGAPRAADDLDLMAEARTREFGSRAHWLGILPPEKMPDLYRAVDAFVLASHHEGLSNSMMEAMATGLPVIVTHVGGHKEIIEDGINGRMVPPGDPPTLAAALRDVLTNPARATGLGHAARDRAVAVGDYRANASMLLRSLKDVLCSRKVQSQMEALLK